MPYFCGRMNYKHKEVYYGGKKEGNFSSKREK